MSSEDPKPKWGSRRDASLATKKHEDRIAERLGGRRIPASGSQAVSTWQASHAGSRVTRDQTPDTGEYGDYKVKHCMRLPKGFADSDEGIAVDVATPKGDVTSADFHVEHKRSVRKSIGVTRQWLNKVREGAVLAGKDPLLVLTFEGSPTVGDDWAVLPLSTLIRLMDERQS